MGKLCIVQVSAADRAGGAERSAWNLFRAYRELGHSSYLLVGRKVTNDPDVIEIPNLAYRNGWVRWWEGVRARGDARLIRIRGQGRVSDAMVRLGEFRRLVNRSRGREDFDFPGTRALLDRIPRPSIFHLHNLHGGYFDLRQLPSLSLAAPTILNCRDAWLATGHCALPLDCKKWLNGCGGCPDLNRYPSIPRDATSFNWERKREIFSKARTYLATPSQWLLGEILQSSVAAGVIASRVIPNGVDCSVFRPGSQSAARARLGVPQDEFVVMTAANGIRRNPWKDYATLRRAMGRLSGNAPQSLSLYAVGERAEAEIINGVRVVFVPKLEDDEVLADYYRSADVYVHSAHAESFGNVLLEARACGVPVVATAVGGIPEHVLGLDCAYSAPASKGFSKDSADGILVTRGDAEAIAGAIGLLRAAGELRLKLGKNGAQRAAQEYSVERQAGRFVAWYEEILKKKTNG